jgi:hypothetical protein
MPPALTAWVRHDLTDADWRWRELLRVLLQCMGPAALLFLLPAPLQIRIFTVGLLLTGALFTAAAFAEDLRDRRLRQHGLLPPTGPDRPGPGGAQP